MADRDMTRDIPGFCVLPARFRLPWLASAVCLWAVLLGLGGCESAAPPPAGFERVTIGETTYTLELAADDEKRTKGLGERASLPENGGMLFVFKRSERRQFLMRDCLIDIDIIFLDANGRITAFHHMPKEPPRAEDEGEVGDWNPLKPGNRRYEGRLKRYSSRASCQYVIEVAGGELEKLDLQVGQKIELDTDRLKALAR